MLEGFERIEALAALGITLESLTEGQAVVSIPWQGNRNDKGSFFAGSLYSAMVVAGWCLAMKACSTGEGHWEAVIKDCQVSFLRPALSDCRAVARLERAAEERKNGGQALFVVVEAMDARERCCALLHGEYRAFRR
jgi:thioesterase domain-containing protein